MNKYTIIKTETPILAEPDEYFDYDGETKEATMNLTMTDVIEELRKFVEKYPDAELFGEYYAGSGIFYNEHVKGGMYHEIMILRES